MCLTVVGNKWIEAFLFGQGGPGQARAFAEVYCAKTGKKPSRARPRKCPSEIGGLGGRGVIVSAVVCAAWAQKKTQSHESLALVFM